jgi:hypothetical protein
MKKACLFIFIALCAALSLHALELGGSFSLGNYGFSPLEAGPRTSAYDPASLFMGGSLEAVEKMADDFSLSIGFLYDPVLRSLAYTKLSYKMGFAEVGIGPIFGLFNSVSSPVRSGISSSVAIHWPGVAFASFRSDASIGSTLSQPGEYGQEKNEIRVGIYLPNIILSANLVSKSFAERLAADQYATTASQEYSMIAEVFDKFAPYQFILKLGWLEESKRYSGAASGVDSLGSFIMGAKINMQLASSFSMALLIDAGIYTIGLENLSGRMPAPTTFFFKTGLSFSLAIGSGQDAAPIQQEEAAAEAPSSEGSEEPAPEADE